MDGGTGVGFYLAKAVATLLSPGTVIVVLLAIAVLLLVRGRRRIGTAIVALLAVGVFAVALTPLPALLLWALEHRIAAPDPLPERVDGIVVLGGAVNPILSRDHGAVALGGAAERLTTFAALARRYGDARLVFAGGTGAVFETGPREADYARELLADLGVDPARVAWDHESRSTVENARHVAQAVRAGPEEIWLLVTSAAHMPRSVGVFRTAGWPVLPVPVDYRVARADRWRPAGLVRGLQLTRGAAYEAAALTAYRLAGHTDAWLPGADGPPAGPPAD